MLFKKIIAVYSKSNIRLINTSVGKMQSYRLLKLVIVHSGLNYFTQCDICYGRTGYITWLGPHSLVGISIWDALHS
jgi:hypothetical protein